MNYGDRHSRRKYNRTASEIADEISKMVNYLTERGTILETTKKTDTEQTDNLVRVNGTAEIWKVQTANTEWVLEKRTGSLRTDE